ncbi:MAG: UDP-forming cellulose synthase catalytic subunit [Acidobacteria bacterium]|nr:UDP-forming cellulose synthase catalytic subunit [Acidobacteriota bacterium]
MVLALAMMATVPLDWKDQAVLGGSLFAIAIFIDRRFSGERASLILMVISLFCAGRYFWWRISETTHYFIANGSQTPAIDIFFVVLLIGAEAYAVVILVLGYFQNARPLRRLPMPLPSDPELWPGVDVLIPTYNEPIEVVRATMLAAMNIDWPRDRLNVYVLDDGKRVEVHRLAQEAGCGYIARLDNVGAKAGNINHALGKTHGEYVAVFDSDHIPTRSFLQFTMGWFLKDVRLAMVQTPHHFYSPDPFERNLGTFRKVPNEGELFYGTLQDGNDFWNALIFCGSCAVLRRSALDEVGGIATETVTEDSHTSLRLLRAGWNTAYINIPQAAGLATANVSDHIGQRIRWARGMVQILRTENPLFGRGLTWPQRLCYLNGTIHFLHATPRLIFLTAPLVYLLLGRSNVYGYSWAILSYVLPHMLMATLTNSRAHGRFRHSFWNEIYETLLAPYILAPTLLALINPRWGKFNVTSKRTVVTKKYFDLRIAAPFLVLMALNIAGLVTAVTQVLSRIDDNGTVLVNMTWALFNTLIVGATLAVPWELRQLRSATRIQLRMRVRLRKRSGVEVPGSTLNISNGGAALQLDMPADLSPDDSAELIVNLGEDEYVLPVTVRRSQGLLVALHFEFSTLAEHEALTRIVFGRADAWLSWTAGRQEDRLIRSFGRVAATSLRGIALIPKGLFSGPESSSLPAAAHETKSAAANAGAAQSAGVRNAVTALLACALLGGSLRADEPFAESRDWLELGQRRAITFQSGEGRVNLTFTMPMTKLVTNAALVLNYKSSGGFPDSAVLNILLNGVALTPVPARQKGGDANTLQKAEVTLPPDLVVSDNTITLHFSGSCPGGCKEGGRWLQIDPTTQVRLSGTMLPLPNNLRALPAPFVDTSLHRLARITMVFAEKPTNETLQAAGVVASWFGVIADDRGTQFAVRAGGVRKGDEIVFATRDSEVIRSLGLKDIEGPQIAMRTNPLDPFGKLLVITGRNGADLLLAAQALATQSYAKDGDRAELGNARLPRPSSPYDAPRWLNPQRANGLGDSISPEQLRWFGAGAVNLYFRLPPDLAFGQRSTVPLRLGFRTAATSEQKGELRVSLNGIRVSSTRISIREGTSVQHQAVYLPVQVLYPSNTLTLEFVLNSIKDSPTDRYPEITVLPNSSIDLHDIPRFVELPRLDLFTQAGFPFTRLADLSGTAVLLPDEPTPDEIACYLGLMGRFGAQTGYPGLRVTVVAASQSQQAASKDLLIIGTARDQPLFARWSDMLPVRVESQFRARKPSGWRTMVDLPFAPIAREFRRLSETLFEGASPEGLLQGLISPLDSSRNAVVLATGEQSSFEYLMQTLGNATSKDIHGSVSLLTNSRFQSFELSEKSNYIGELSWLETFYTWIGRNFYLIILAVIGCALPLTRWFSKWADQHAAWRLQGSR